MATTVSNPSANSGARVRVQKFGTFLSNMVLPKATRSGTNHARMLGNMPERAV